MCIAKLRFRHKNVEFREQLINIFKDKLYYIFFKIIFKLIKLKLTTAR